MNNFSEGRGAAAEVDAWLSNGSTRLPSAGGIKARVSICLTCVVVLILTCVLTRRRMHPLQAH